MTHGGQKTELGSLEMELQVVVSCHVALAVEPRSSAQAVSAFHCQGLSAAPLCPSWPSVCNNTFLKQSHPTFWMGVDRCRQVWTGV